VTRLVVIGGGAAGMSAEALVGAGVEVEVVEALPGVLATVDEPVAELARAAVVKVFSLEVARTGLGLAEARAVGLDAVATDMVSRSRANYYPGSSPLHVRLVHTPEGRLLGGQLAGHEGAAKRIDVLATALHAGLTVHDLAALDLSYAPPFAPVYDPVLAAAAKATSTALSMTGGSL
jgi:CoA-dependent NAD(P)H sulfur oxidoreductase